MKIEITTDLSKLEALPEKLRYRMGNSIGDIETDVYENTNLKVPIRTGKLRSGFLSTVSYQSDLVIQEINYSAISQKGNYDYALIQHEKDFKHPRGGDKLYLKTGFEESKELILKDIEDFVLEAIR